MGTVGVTGWGESNSTSGSGRSATATIEFCKSALRVTILAIRRQRGRLYMNTSTRIQWIRVLIGGFLAEASVFAMVIPIFMISGQHALVYAAPSPSLVISFLFPPRV